MRLLVASTIIVAVALLASCGGDGGGSGVVFLPVGQGIGVFDVDANEQTTIATATAKDTFAHPALSPDGESIVFVNSYSGATDGKLDISSDLWMVGRDGSDARIVFEHTAPNQTMYYPQWLDDSTILVLLRAANNSAVPFYSLQRVDLETGEAELIVASLFYFGVSHDRDRLVYSAVDAEGFSLVVSDIDGSDPVTVIPSTATFGPFGSPAFSPDGDTIVFAAADRAARLPGLSGDGARGLLHGAPQDIWQIDAAGGEPRRLTDLQEDSPSFAFSGDGETLFTLGVSGLYSIDVATGVPTKLSDAPGHSAIAWAD